MKKMTGPDWVSALKELQAEGTKGKGVRLKDVEPVCEV